MRQRRGDADGEEVVDFAGSGDQLRRVEQGAQPPSVIENVLERDEGSLSYSRQRVEIGVLRRWHSRAWNGRQPGLSRLQAGAKRRRAADSEATLDALLCNTTLFSVQPATCRSAWSISARIWRTSSRPTEGSVVASAKAGGGQKRWWKPTSKLSSLNVEESVVAAPTRFVPCSVIVFLKACV